MEAPGKGDDAGAARGGARDLHRVLGRFRAGGEEDGLGFAFHRRNRVQLLGQLDVRFIGHDLKRRVRIGVELFGNGRHHAGMAVPHVEHRDAAREIDVALALDVPDLGILGTGREDRRGRGNATRHSAFAAFENGLVRHEATPAARVGCARGKGRRGSR